MLTLKVVRDIRRKLVLMKNKLVVQIRSHFPRATRNQKKRIHKILAQRIKAKLNWLLDSMNIDRFSQIFYF